MATYHQKELVNSLSNLFGSSKYSDLTIRCGSDTYKVHRAVICQRSKVFAAICDSGFEEAMTATITLNDDDQPTVRRMLTYLYTLDYDDADTPHSVDVAALRNDGHVAGSSSKPDVVDEATASHCKRMNNVRVYALAEKYDIPVLKELAKTKFKLRNDACDFPCYREVVNAICESTPETDMGLRNIAILECANASMIEKCLKEEGLAPVIRDHGSFGLGMLREVVKNHNQELEMQTRFSKNRVERLRLALGSLYRESTKLDILDKEDLKDNFRRYRRALGTFQGRVKDVWLES